MDSYRRATRRATGAEMVQRGAAEGTRKALRNLTNGAAGGAAAGGKGGKAGAGAKRPAAVAALEPPPKRAAGSQPGEVDASRALVHSLLDGADADADEEEEELLCDQVPRYTEPAPGRKAALDATDITYAFSHAGGRRRTEAKHPQMPYISAESLSYNACVRQQLVDWVLLHALRLGVDMEAVHLAVRYADEFLWRRGADAFLQDSRGRPPPFAVPAGALLPGPGLARPPPRAPHAPGAPPARGGLPPLCNKLKRLGTTCLWVASKVAEVSCPSCVEFTRDAAVPLFGREQIILAERALIRTLGFITVLPTVASFAGAYLDAAASAGHVTGTALVRASTILFYLCDLALLPHDALRMPCSRLGAAVASMALQACVAVRWRDTNLPAMSGYAPRELAEPRALLRAVALDAPSFVQAAHLPALGGRHVSLHSMSAAIVRLHDDADA